MKALQIILKIKEEFLNALYPPDAVCYICNEERVLNQYLICEGCYAAIKRPTKTSRPDGIKDLTAAFLYTEEMHQCIYKFKYGGEQHLALPLSKSIVLPKGIDNSSVIVPVPLHKKRFKERGYNQSELLANEIGKNTGLMVDTTLLERIKETKVQASLTKKERVQNVKDAFKANNAQSKTILLIDDLCTTGNTLSQCALTLKNNGAKAVYAACICFVEQ